MNKNTATSKLLRRFEETRNKLTSDISSQRTSRITRVNPSHIRRALLVDSLLENDPSIASSIPTPAGRFNRAEFLFQLFFVIDFPFILIVELLDLFDTQSESLAIAKHYSIIHSIMYNCLYVLTVVAGLRRSIVPLVLCIALIGFMQSVPEMRPFAHRLESYLGHGFQFLLSRDTWHMPSH